MYVSRLLVEDQQCCYGFADHSWSFLFLGKWQEGKRIRACGVAAAIQLRLPIRTSRGRD
jgi:hypothetical protein